MAEDKKKAAKAKPEDGVKRGGPPLNTMEAAKILKKLVGEIETSDMTSLFELVRHLYSNGTVEEWEVLGSKTPFLSDYLVSRVEYKKDAKKERVEQLRSSKRNAEIRRLESESPESVKAQFDETMAGLSDADMRLMLGFLAGERAIQQARKKSAQ